MNQNGIAAREIARTLVAAVGIAAALQDGVEPNRRTTVILNSSSGWDPRDDAPGAIRRAFAERGADCLLRQVAAGTNIEALAAEAVREGSDRVVAGGGDGTLRAVAAALAGTGALMGVLPVGTLNHFARDMEIPLDVAGAAAVAAGGVPVCVDVAEVNGQVFLNNSIIGLYPFYFLERHRVEEGGGPKQLAVIRAMLRTFIRYPVLTVRLRSEAGEVVRRTPYMLIANNEHAMEGFKPWERDSMTEGRLWVYVLRDRSRWGFVRSLLKVATGGRLAGEEFEVFRTGEVAIETRRRWLDVAIDGEVVRMPTPLVYRSRPGELKVLVPQGSKRVQESVCPVEETAP